MKASKKLLLIVAGFIIILLIVSLIVLRKDIGTLMEKQTFIEYKSMPVGEFKSLEFSTNWKVQIKQGKDCKVELAIRESDDLIPVLENKNDILYLGIDNKRINQNSESIHVRLTAPFLKTIEAEGNTEIVMKNYWSDSLTVVLTDSSTFYGKNNDFTNIKFKAFTRNE